MDGQEARGLGQGEVVPGGERGSVRYSSFASPVRPSSRPCSASSTGRCGSGTPGPDLNRPRGPSPSCPELPDPPSVVGRPSVRVRTDGGRYERVRARCHLNGPWPRNADPPRRSPAPASRCVAARSESRLQAAIEGVPPGVLYDCPVIRSHAPFDRFSVIPVLIAAPGPGLRRPGRRETSSSDPGMSALLRRDRGGEVAPGRRALAPARRTRDGRRRAGRVPTRAVVEGVFDVRERPDLSTLE